MSSRVAAALVFVSSAAVLVLEILAGRLLAPYVGITLEAFTGIIGVILAGIAVGSWLGGRAADRTDPRHLLGPLVIVGGGLSFVAIPIVDAIASGLRGATPSSVVLLTLLAFFAPAAVLSAVTPVVIKLRLSSLEETGEVVGRLSAIGTAGAITGTFVTGFVLVAQLPTRPTIRLLAGALVLLGIGLTVWLRGRKAVTLGTIVGVVAAGAASFAFGRGPCEFESAYFCGAVVIDPASESGRVLWLDTLRHSYVDLDDPTHLAFSYTQVIADAIEGSFPAGEPLDVVHVGGGGLTMPRYLRATRPGSDSVVLERDASLYDVVVEEMGFVPGDDVELITGDARLTLRQVPDDGADVVIGDAFGGVSIPWHLTTVEFLSQVRSTLRDDGIYVANVIDYGARDFLRAELATLLEVFEHAAVFGPPGRLGPRDEPAGGNAIVVASDAPIDVEGILAANASRDDDEVALTGRELDQFVRGAPVLTDDDAPVEQLLTPYPVAPAA